MRIFFGIGFKDSVKAYLESVQAHVKCTAIGGNFTLYDNFHLTLRYLGHIEPSKLDALVEINQTLSAMHGGFNLKIGDLGAFGHGEKKTLFVRVQDNQAALVQIDRDLQKLLSTEGFEYDQKKFLPHITIAREVRFNNHINVSTPLPYYPEAINVQAVTLFESRRVHGYLRYETLHVGGLKQ